MKGHRYSAPGPVAAAAAEQRERYAAAETELDRDGSEDRVGHKSGALDSEAVAIGGSTAKVAIAASRGTTMT